MPKISLYSQNIPDDEVSSSATTNQSDSAYTSSSHSKSPQEKRATQGRQDYISLKTKKKE